MKISKIIIPTAVAVGTIAPAITLAGCSCGTKSDITVDQKTIKSGDSYTTYKFKLPTVPSDKRVTVTIDNKSTEKVYFDPDLTPDLSNAGMSTEASLPVSDDGTVEAAVCLDNAPTESSSSTFGLTFKYGDTTKTVNDLKFDYTVDYDVDLKDGKWESKITPAEASHWTGKDVASLYVQDVEKTPTIFQSDARYSTSLNIKKAIDDGKIEKIKSLRAYFNDIYKDSNGLNVQMNYEIKADTDGKFEFIQTGQGSEGKANIKYTYTNFDLSCNFSTANGYKFAWDSTNKAFNLTDPEEKYDLIGRMKGKFDAVVSYDQTGSGTYVEIYKKQNVSYDGIINYDETTNDSLTDKFVAFMFANGLVHLTYNFDWATEKPNLQVISSYAKNA